MEKIYSICCGLDVHKDLIVACLIRPDQKPIIKEFQSTYSSLQELAEWLLMEECEMVAMESTSVYWKTLANTFENHGISFVIVNAQHLKALSRHKTDKSDALYIAERLQFGLLKGSFVPPREQRILRQLTRGRDNFIKDRATYVNRLQKALDESGIKLSSFVSNIAGTSSRKLIDYILEHRSFPTIEIINQLISSRIKASREDIADALRGKITAQQVVLIRGILRTIDNCDFEIDALSTQINEFLSEQQCEKKTKLCGIKGVGTRTAEVILAEIGDNVNKFPSAHHLASWIGLSPGNNESGGKRLSGRIGKGNNYLKTKLIAIMPVVISQPTFFKAQYQKLRSRLGYKKAIVAVAHSLVLVIYHILSGEDYIDLGHDYFSKINPEQKAKRLLKQVRNLGIDPVRIQELLNN